MIDPVATLRNIGGIDRIVMNDGLVWLSERDDNRPCKCCAFECEVEVAISIEFCGMSVNVTMPIPGFLDTQANIVSLPDGSYLIPSASIYCTPCGWTLAIEICAYCAETEQFASEGFTASIPFAAAEETFGAGHCPELGEVDLQCFGEQFGIPCITTTSATVQ